MFHDWWLAKFWTPIVEQLFHSWSIWFWQVFHNWGLNVPQMGGKTVPQWDLTFFLFSDRNKFFFHTLGWLGLTKVMSILTASNPLILALVLSLYHVSKESYRILKLKKFLKVRQALGTITLSLVPQGTNSRWSQNKIQD